NPEKRTIDLSTDKIDPFLAGAPAKGLDKLDMETRSLLQVLFFVAHGVEVPPAHAVAGVAPLTFGPDGSVFDWDLVLGGLFKGGWGRGNAPPAGAPRRVLLQGLLFLHRRARPRYKGHVCPVGRVVPPRTRS